MHAVSTPQEVTVYPETHTKPHVTVEQIPSYTFHDDQGYLTP